jgi:hypothetical protein
MVDAIEAARCARNVRPKFAGENGRVGSKNGESPDLRGFPEVEDTGLEPVTSTLPG